MLGRLTFGFWLTLTVGAAATSKPEAEEKASGKHSAVSSKPPRESIGFRAHF